MESRLLAYRAQKRREAKIAEMKARLLTFFKLKKPDGEDAHDSERTVPLIPQTPPDPSVENEDAIIESLTFKDMIYNNPTRVLFFALWIVSFLIFVMLQWGAVYFIVSALLFVYFNTRTGGKKPGELSAYSVFNKDCKNIEGALTAEQLESEIRFGRGALTI